MLTLPPWPDLEDVLERPGVIHDMPADWWEMVALGRHPSTGAPLAETAAA